MRALAARLARAGVPSPDHDARALVLHALGLTTAGLLTRITPLNAEEAATLEALAARREARVPLQHLLGSVEWGDVALRVTPAALVPRPETEVLLHLALSALRGVPEPCVLDVGTGTGALAVAVAHARPDAHVTATDVSDDALALARENATRNGTRVAFLHADLLHGAPTGLHLVVSNPPYLPDADRENADPEVQHDPPLALYGGADGLDLARQLAAQAPAHLRPGGTLALELDPRNVHHLAAELRNAGWSARVHDDLTGRARFITATR